MLFMGYILFLHQKMLQMSWISEELSLPALVIREFFFPDVC
jgi:hypothetical protein